MILCILLCAFLPAAYGVIYADDDDDDDDSIEECCPQAVFCRLEDLCRQQLLRTICLVTAGVIK